MISSTAAIITCYMTGRGASSGSNTVLTRGSVRHGGSLSPYLYGCPRKMTALQDVRSTAGAGRAGITTTCTSGRTW